MCSFWDVYYSVISSYILITVQTTSKKSKDVDKVPNVWKSGSHLSISKCTVRLARIIPKLFSSEVKLKTLDTPPLCISLQVPMELTLMVSNFKFCQRKQL